MLLEVLALERLDRDLFRSTVLFEEQWPLFGGQVAAQALLAAGATVEPGRTTHSLHGYFLRPGDSREPVVFTVERDRDGRSFSARRVVARSAGVLPKLKSTGDGGGAGPPPWGVRRRRSAGA